jgi:hypothetical protein
MLKKMKNLLTRQDGSGVLIGGLCMFVFLGLGAVSVDIGHLVSVKAELQRSADAGAMAGARALWPTALPMVLNPPSTPDCVSARSVARTVTMSPNNPVNGTPLSAENLTIEVGQYDYATKAFTPKTDCTLTSNAVRVQAGRDLNNIFFARIWNITRLQPRVQATASMGFAKAVGKGTIPIAINKFYVVPGNILTINFNPDPLDNGGWFADPPDKANAATFKDYIVNDSCPPLQIGDIINLQNGVDTTALSALKNEVALHPGGYDAFLPVVNTDKFNTSEPIQAFVPFRITEVRDTGNDKGITGKILGLAQCGGALAGSDVNYGTLTPPKAVN